MQFIQNKNTIWKYGTFKLNLANNMYYEIDIVPYQNILTSAFHIFITVPYFSYWNGDPRGRFPYGHCVGQKFSCSPGQYFVYFRQEGQKSIIIMMFCLTIYKELTRTCGKLQTLRSRQLLRGRDTKFIKSW